MAGPIFWQITHSGIGCQKPRISHSRLYFQDPVLLLRQTWKILTSHRTVNSETKRRAATVPAACFISRYLF